MWFCISVQCYLREVQRELRTNRRRPMPHAAFRGNSVLQLLLSHAEAPKGGVEGNHEIDQSEQCLFAL